MASLASLSPWPASTAAVALAAATARLKAAIDPEADDARVQVLGATAAALVEQYAPSAPQVLKDMAVEMAAGRIHESPRASVRSEHTGDVSTSFAPSLTGVLLHSGCKSLLYPFRVKTAGTAK